MDEKKYRQEIKFLLSPTQAIMSEQRIRAVMEPDGHSGADGSYGIRSIYFDTVSDKAYSEKLAGVATREKFRIRFYNMNSDTIHLERKEKREQLVYKETLPISKAVADQIMSGNYEGLLSYGHPLAAHLYAMRQAEALKPVVIVDYNRNAYIYPAGNVRITFDSALQAGRITDNIWEPGNLSDVSGGDTILEVKFNQYLPEHIRQLICSVPGTKTALSKYTLCRENLRSKQGDYIGGK